MRRANSLEKTLMLGKTQSKREGGRQRMRLLDSIVDSMAMNLSKPQEIVKDMGACPQGCKESDTIWSLNNKMKGGFPWWLSGKEFACQTREMGSNPGSGRSPGEGNGNSFQYSCLVKHMDRGAW